MARMARVMVENHPFHITHRGNQRRTVFHSDMDRMLYLSLLHRFAKKFEMAIWAFCLMNNHVHVIAVGRQRFSIARAIGNAHQVFTRREHEKREVTGHLWANRFFSTALDVPHLWAAVRYVELNPVRAGIVRRATDYRWSSARAHAGLATGQFLDPARPFPGPIEDWAAWLHTGLPESTIRLIRRQTSTGRPTGSKQFVTDLERRLGRCLRPRRRGRRAKSRPQTRVRETSPI